MMIPSNSSVSRATGQKRLETFINYVAFSAKGFLMKQGFSKSL